MESHQDYLRRLIGTDLYDFIVSYTGADKHWMDYQELLRRFNVQGYTRAVARYGQRNIFDMRRRLNSLIESAPKIKRVTLFRGTSFRLPIVDGLMVDWGFSGASLNKSRGLEFGSPLVYELIFPDDSPILFINSISKVSDEIEALISAGAEYHFLNEYAEDDKIIIRAVFTRLRRADDNPMYESVDVDEDYQASLFSKFKILMNQTLAASPDLIKAQMNKIIYDTPDGQFVGRQRINTILRNKTEHWCLVSRDRYSVQYLPNLHKYLA